jgi:integrase
VSVLEDRAQEIEDQHGTMAAQTFIRVATGKMTPLAAHLDAWLADALYEDRTQGDHRRAVDRFALWLISQSHPATLEAVSRRIAGDFVMRGLKGGGHAPKTVNKYISSLSSYWTWLERRGLTDGNPWLRQGVPKKAAVAGRRTTERAFTDAEVVRLFSGTEDRHLLDVMSLLALSGMRIEELYQFTVGNVLPDGRFHILDSKTPAGIRLVPIHPDLVGIVARLSKGRSPDVFLIAEGSASKERSMAMSKRLNRYRQTVGVHEKIDGQRRSLVNAHSFRRWFITKAERAGETENIIAAVVGHKRQGITFGVYSDGPSVEQHRNCVEVVRLPIKPQDQFG